MSPEDREFFDKLLPEGSDFVTARELGSAAGVSANYVRRCCEGNEILSMIPQNQGKKGKRRSKSYRIPRDLAALWLASVSNFGPQKLIPVLVSIAKSRLSKPQLLQLISELNPE
ncbi:MAG: hypothetical protein ACPGSB_03505 [Opitutales bacterium]